ncbi:hypothetical protein MKX01_005896 [Papaver californicum]|nr:hypothetical protein MKX01_005896 [Papaver californicum]
MEAINSGLAYQLLPYLYAYKNSRVERLSHYRDEFVPPSIFRDLKMSVSSKDVVIVKTRIVLLLIFLITLTKLPLLVYFHGGAFCTYSAFNPRYHDYLNSVVAEENVVAISVEYKRAPENPLPMAYEDSWETLKWVLSHSISDQQGHEIWLSDHADFNQVILGGDSSGANIAHNMAILAGITPEQIFGLKLWGVHPHFLGWNELTLKKSGWEGVAEIMESKGEGHVLHLHNPSSENALNMMKVLVSFVHQHS